MIHYDCRDLDLAGNRRLELFDTVGSHQAWSVFFAAREINEAPAVFSMMFPRVDSRGKIKECRRHGRRVCLGNSPAATLHDHRTKVIIVGPRRT